MNPTEELKRQLEDAMSHAKNTVEWGNMAPLLMMEVQIKTMLVLIEELQRSRKQVEVVPRIDLIRGTRGRVN